MLRIEEFIKQEQISNQPFEAMEGVEYLTLTEYAKKVGKSVNTIKNMIAKGIINNAKKYGHVWYIPYKVIDKTRDIEYMELIKENARLKEKLRTVLNVIQEN